MVLNSVFPERPVGIAMNLMRLALLGFILIGPFASSGRADDAAELVSRGMQKFRNNDIAGSLAEMLKSLPSDDLTRFRTAIQEAAEPFRSSGGYEFPGLALGVSASK